MNRIKKKNLDFQNKQITCPLCHSRVGFLHHHFFFVKISYRIISLHLSSSHLPSSLEHGIITYTQQRLSYYFGPWVSAFFPFKIVFSRARFLFSFLCRFIFCTQQNLNLEFYKHVFFSLLISSLKNKNTIRPWYNQFCDIVSNTTW